MFSSATMTLFLDSMNVTEILIIQEKEDYFDTTTSTISTFLNQLTSCSEGHLHLKKLNLFTVKYRLFRNT